MGRLTFSGARTGRRASTNNFSGIQRLDYQMGEQKRLIFPVMENAEGEKGLMVLAEPYHRVKAGFVNVTTNSGKVFSPYQIRCMHPYSQTDRSVAINSAERGEMCPFCELAQYEMRHTYATLEERYGEDGFKDLSKEEQKAFYKEMEGAHQVEQSYYSKVDDDGNKQNFNIYEMALLALELELEEFTVTKGGKTRKGYRPVMGENGIPKYKKILMPMSANRLDKFKMAADNAFEQGTLNIDDHQWAYVENEGTEFEEEVLVGFVDFAVKFPVKGSKMESGKDMSVIAVTSANSVITDEFVAAIQAEGKKLQEDAETAFKNLNISLRAHTPAEALEMMADGGTYYEEMKEAFAREDDEVFNQKVFDTVLGNAQQPTVEDAGDEVVEETEVAETSKSKPKAKPQAKPQSKKGNEEVQVAEDDEEIEDVDDMLEEFAD